jgi:hypothetical protein
MMLLQIRVSVEWLGTSMMHLAVDEDTVEARATAKRLDHEASQLNVWDAS